MDNAEQSSRPPSKGIFDTASLLGIPSPQTLCKTNLLTNLVGGSGKKISKVKLDKELNHAASITQDPLTGIPLISGNQVLMPSKKPLDPLNEQISRLLSSSEKQIKKKNKPKAPKSEVLKNGKKSKTENTLIKHPKEKKGKKSSSESEGQNLDTSSGSSTGADSTVGGSSSSSDSSDEEEREKQQKQLAKLKKQQQELRRKVQELKQASHDVSHLKPEPQIVKKPSGTKNSILCSGVLNHSTKPVPSPAHSSPIMPMTISPEVIPLGCDLIPDDEQNAAFPLDLCMKKQEPTFEVTTPSTSSFMLNTATTSTKKKLFPATSAVHGANSNSNKSTAPKKRGRKPKAIQMPMVPPPAHSEKVRQRKRSSIKDIQSLLMPSKMDLLAGHCPNPSLLKVGNSISCPKVHTSNALTSHSDIFPHPRKNFTLDCLLSETNGNLHFPLENDSNLFPSSSMSNKFFKFKDRTKNNKIKKTDEKVKEIESPSHLESTSPSDSDPDEDTTDGEDSEHSHCGSNASTPSSRKRKHSYDEDSEEYRNKKRRILPDEREVQIPLEHGWRRETRIRCFSKSGVRGEVSYYTPCGKKLRSYPEVVRYLVKNGISDISRDNFTFSTKVNVGEFLECTGSGQDYILLSEQEVASRIEETRCRRGRISVQNRKLPHHSIDDQELQKQWEQKQIQHHFDQQEKTREALETKLLRQAHKEQALMIAREEKRTRAEENRKQKEQQRLLKQQEKFERMEQMRIEREIRNQQIIEEQEIKRQQAVFLREQERERRRQHMILVRALENRKKQEERERKREEILFEKRINREKKMEQRRMELDYLRELKKPVDDMILKDLISLPTLNRIPGVKIPGKAFADILMVFEFLHNFGETLGFDVESLPTLNTLQMALLNLDEKCEEELLSVVHHLLVCAIDDPGVPHSSESATILGQSLKDADITNSNVSEVLRLYFIAQDKRNLMLEWLQSKPFLSLNASQKAEIIAHICDELLTSRLLTRQIDSNIENVNVLRKDKWLIEGELRRYRSIQQRRALKAKLSEMEENRNNPNCANMLSADIPDYSLNQSKDNQALEDAETKEKSENEKLEEMEKELANESGNESDDTQAPGQISDAEDEDLHLSNDEINKKIDKLSKQLTQCSNKLTKAFYTIRGATFGMDRFHRRYWVFPKSGGVFVESMESSLKPDEREKVLKMSKEVIKAVDIEMNVDNNEKTDPIKPIEVENIKEEEKEETSQCDIINNQAPTVKNEELEIDKTQEDILEKNLALSKNIKTEHAKIDDKVEQNMSYINKTDSDSKKENELNMVESDSKLTEKSDAEALVTTEKVKKKIESDNSNNKSYCDVNSPKNIINTGSETKTAANSELNNQETHIQESTSSISESIVLEEKESKLSLDMQSSSKASWEHEKKLLKDVDPFPNLKREREHKSKKEDKKEIKQKESERFLGLKMDIKDEKKPNVNIFMPNLCDNSINLDLGAVSKLHNNSDRHHTPSPSIPPDQSWLFNSPLFASILAGNMLFNGPMVSQRDINGTYFNLPKNDSHNPFGPFLGLQPGMLAADQIFKSMNDKHNNQKPWFSILPRMPCDESLFHTPQSHRNPMLHSPGGICSSDTRSSRIDHTSSSNPGHVASALSNLQMELMNGVVPPGFFLHPFLPPQFGGTFQPPTTCTSHLSSYTSTMSHSSPMPDFNLNLSRPPPSSTPNSIPTPSATPLPTSHGCATPTSRDSPSPNFAKRLMMEKLTQEYPDPLPIPAELQRGWWRITDSSQLQSIISALHHRGVREKMFQKQLQKHFQFACTSCSLGHGKDTELDITDKDQEVFKQIGGAPEIEPSDFWFQDIALRVDLSILEQVENLEEKVDGSSMQVKFWKPPSKLSTEPSNKFLPACEQYVHLTATDIYNGIKERLQRKNAKKGSSKKKKPQKKEIEPEPEPADIDLEKKSEEENTDTAAEPSHEMDTSESIEPTIDEADKLPLEDLKLENDIIPLPPGKMNPVEEAKKRLLKVEAAIERRYLKPPLGVNANELKSALSNCGSTTPPSSESPEDDPIPQGLSKWRNAVENCKSAAQLAMCLNFLEACTAWDKSIMRASCQFCHSGDNEEKLLLCDGCDKGYHTYCFKPVMETIPDGDWYCFECLNKATGDNVCVICGTKGKLIKCEACPKTFHLNCLEPPLAKMPKGKWYCSGCSLTRPPKKSAKKSTPAKEKELKEKEIKETPEKPPKKNEGTPSSSKSKSTEKKEKKEKPPQPPLGNKDLAPCGLILDDMEKHEDAWPFLNPVNTKQFPTYRKVIKKPMDIATMRGKLDVGQYKSVEEFASDARLIFDNCETFNEDDSPVGQAGHSMRAFFETRWSDLCMT